MFDELSRERFMDNSLQLLIIDVTWDFSGSQEKGYFSGMGAFLKKRTFSWTTRMRVCPVSGPRKRKRRYLRAWCSCGMPTWLVQG